MCLKTKQNKAKQWTQNEAPNKREDKEGKMEKWTDGTNRSYVVNLNSIIYTDSCIECKSSKHAN